jgi:cbb3-type cytochrome oxidase subunit 3
MYHESNREDAMKIALYVIAFSLLTMGIIWILQGVNVLPGSFMTGQLVWAKRGAVVALAGLAVLAYALWRGRHHSDKAA